MFGLNEDQQALTWAAAFVLGVSLGRWIGQWKERRRRNLPALKDTVEKSCLLTAAWRAVENMELEGRILSDDLAASLAGQGHVAAALEAAVPMDSNVEPPPGRRLYKISQVAARTFWFDRQIMTALTSPAVPASKGWLSSRLRGSFSARGPSAPPRQIVVLGAGMDSRPWRLPLPPGCSWFEIDSENVMKCKLQLLHAAGAQLPHGDTATPVTYPLRSHSWNAISADLTGGSWMEALIDKGFDPKQPTVWVLEGILMYLSTDEAQQVLETTARAAAPGSTLLLHALTDEIMDALRLEFSDSSTNEIGNQNPETSANGSASAFDAHEEDRETSNIIQESSAFFPRDLMSKWKSSVPKDPSSMLADIGWVQQAVVTRASIALELCGGAPEGKCAFETRQGQGADRHVVFVTSRKGVT